MKVNEEIFFIGCVFNFVNNMIYIIEMLYCLVMGFYLCIGFLKILLRILFYVNLFVSDIGKMFLLIYYNFGFVFFLVVYLRFEIVWSYFWLIGVVFVKGGKWSKYN